MRKEMPDLTPAAHRREAARRLNVDYDTFLLAWKKTAKKPDVTPPPVVVPDPPIKVPKLTPKEPAPTPSIPSLTYDTARAQHKLVKKERPDLSDAEARREAARRMNVDYDSFLKAWKKPKGGAPAPPPRISPQTPTVTPKPVTKQAVTVNTRSIGKYLESRGFKKSVKSKERLTHTGRSYGGGISESEGFIIRKGSGGSVDVSYRPGFSSREAVQERMAKMKADLQDAGLIIEPHTPLSFRIVPPPAQKVKDAYLPWKRKEVRTEAVDSPKPKFSYESQGTYEMDFIVDGQFVARLLKRAGTGRWMVRYGKMDDPGLESILNRMRVRSLNLDEIEDAYHKGITEGLPDHRMVNPGRRLGVSGTQNNCTSCATSYELRRRGFDVRAVKMPQGKMLADVYRSWGIEKEHQLFSNAIDYWPSSISQSTWITRSQSLPDGARGFLSVNWERGGAHILNWEKRDGEIWYIDAQVGEEFRGKYPRFTKARNEINIVRTDELEIAAEDVGWLTSDKEGQVPLDRKAAPSWARL